MNSNCDYIWYKIGFAIKLELHEPNIKLLINQNIGINNRTTII